VNLKKVHYKLLTHYKCTEWAPPQLEHAHTPESLPDDLAQERVDDNASPLSLVDDNASHLSLPSGKGAAC
jgi:hypothetical protein